MVHCKINFLGVDYMINLVEERYAANNQIAIKAVLPTGEPFGTLSCCIPTAELLVNHFCVKTWSENQTWYKQILEQLPDYFEDTGDRVKTGFTIAEIWRLKQSLN